ncbi:hypothetical protein GALMADRAFT_145105 [Galerina marginata CBS 339.88]|uniref:NACHT domain-containing protein n=1 Tax=Galerina marginata (strain CBS 339.88) TaxID=685588 RepID=A0A067SGL0_GALM3|nr:hypothetical protein GALMADRAFT_145105 [Galerina marginata CBS 339.88]
MALSPLAEQASMFVVNAPMLVTGGVFNNVNNPMAPNGALRIIKEAFKGNIAPNATHDTNDPIDPPRCYPRTRTAILQNLLNWVRRAGNPSLIVWIFGPAGVGKSAIARSLAEILITEGLLGASFFFFRTADGRNHERFLISTIAYQLAFAIPELRPHIAAAADEKPFLFQQSIESQIEDLIVRPSLSVYFPSERVIIIDGLDECNNRDAQRRIVTTIGNAAPRLAGRLKFLILSRPEHDIESAFDQTSVKMISYSIDLKRDLKAHDDILLFVKTKFDEIKTTHPLKSNIESSWPSEAQILALVSKSSGNFIFAQTVMKYIGITYERPQERLEVILDRLPSSDSPFAELDELYRQILSRVRVARELLLGLLGVILACTADTLHKPDLTSSMEFLETILFLQPGDSKVKLIDLQSIISIEQRGWHPSHTFPHFLHTSFSDFLLDPVRSREYCVELPKVYTYIATSCIKILDQRITDIERTNCNCGTMYAICNHRCDNYYSVLFWSCDHSPPSASAELQLALKQHDIGNLFDLFLGEGINKKLWTKVALTITAYFNGLMHSEMIRGTDISLHHLRRFWERLTKASRIPFLGVDVPLKLYSDPTYMLDELREWTNPTPKFKNLARFKYIKKDVNSEEDYIGETVYDNDEEILVPQKHHQQILGLGTICEDATECYRASVTTLEYLEEAWIDSVHQREFEAREELDEDDAQVLVKSIRARL